MRGVDQNTEYALNLVRRKAADYRRRAAVGQHRLAEVADDLDSLVARVEARAAERPLLCRAVSYSGCICELPEDHEGPHATGGSMILWTDRLPSWVGSE